jgi:hypothetical protein
MKNAVLWVVDLVRTDVSEELLTLFLARTFFPPEVGGDLFLLNVTSDKTHRVSHPRRAIRISP